MFNHTVQLLRLLPAQLPRASMSAVIACLKCVMALRRKRMVASRRFGVELLPLLMTRAQVCVCVRVRACACACVFVYVRVW